MTSLIDDATDFAIIAISLIGFVAAMALVLS